MIEMLKKWALATAVLALTASAANADAPMRTLVSGVPHQALFSIAFQGDVGVAVGAGGEMMESADGGKTWKIAPVDTQLALLGVGLAEHHAIVVGQMGTVLVMSPDGKWTKQNSGTKNRLFNVDVNAAGDAVAVGAYGTIIQSTDGGKSWSSIAPSWQGYTKYGDQPHLYAVNVDKSGLITVAGELGLIIQSADGGKTWKTLHKGNEDTNVGVSSLFAMQFLPDGVGYAVGQNGAILQTKDNGATWTKLDSGTHSILLGVHADPNGTIYVTGMHDMLVSKDAGATWQHVDDPRVTSSWLEGVASPAPGKPVLAVGQAGNIVEISKS